MWNCEQVLVVNKCVVNTWCDNTCVVSCELYNNLISVDIEKMFMHNVKKKVYVSYLETSVKL